MNTPNFNFPSYVNKTPTTTNQNAQLCFTIPFKLRWDPEEHTDKDIATIEIFKLYTLGVLDKNNVLTCTTVIFIKQNLNNKKTTLLTQKKFHLTFSEDEGFFKSVLDISTNLFQEALRDNRFPYLMIQTKYN